MVIKFESESITVPVKNPPKDKEPIGKKKPGRDKEFRRSTSAANDDTFKDEGRNSARSPEFLMEDKNDQEVVDAYMMAALWSSTDDDGNPLDGGRDKEDISDESREKMKADVGDFINKITGLLDISTLDRTQLQQLGHDFWLTRNHHGSGFWDGEWDAIAQGLNDKLTEIAESFGEVNMVIGDDQKVYAEGIADKALGFIGNKMFKNIRGSQSADTADADVKKLVTAVDTLVKKLYDGDYQKLVTMTKKFKELALRDKEKGAVIYPTKRVQLFNVSKRSLQNFLQQYPDVIGWSQTEDRGDVFEKNQEVEVKIGDTWSLGHVIFVYTDTSDYPGMYDIMLHDKYGKVERVVPAEDIRIVKTPQEEDKDSAGSRMEDTDSIFDFFKLRPGKDGRVDTSWGTKTSTGLIAVLNRLIGESRDDEKLGQTIIEILNLKMKGDKVDTSWGTKTAVGLANSVKRIVSEGHFEAKGQTNFEVTVYGKGDSVLDTWTLSAADEDEAESLALPEIEKTRGFKNYSLVPMMDSQPTTSNTKKKVTTGGKSGKTKMGEFLGSLGLGDDILKAVYSESQLPESVVHGGYRYLREDKYLEAQSLTNGDLAKIASDPKKYLKMRGELLGPTTELLNLIGGDGGGALKEIVHTLNLAGITLNSAPGEIKKALASHIK